MEEKAQKSQERENLSEESSQERSQEQNHGFAIHSPGRMDSDPFSISDEKTKAVLPPKSNSI
jgi:hypothetical protein